MSSYKKAFLGASVMTLMLALVAAACLVVVAMASVGSRTAEAQPRSGAPDNPLKYPSAFAPPNPLAGSTYKVVAKCPSDHQVIGGGFQLFIADTPWRLLESRPATAREAGFSTAWVVEALLPANPGRTRVPFTVDAVCVPESLVPRGSIDYPDRTVEVGANQNRELTPDCRPSHQAIGGGFGLSNTSLYLIRSQPNPGNGFRSWIVAAGRRPGGSSKLSAYTVCVRKDLVKDFSHKDQPQSNSGPRNFVSAFTPRCPHGTYPLSGGGGTSNGDAKNISWDAMRPEWNRPFQQDPRGWHAAAKDERTVRVPNITIHAHATCGALGHPADR